MYSVLCRPASPPYPPGLLASPRPLFQTQVDGFFPEIGESRGGALPSRRGSTSSRIPTSYGTAAPGVWQRRSSHRPSSYYEDCLPSPPRHCVNRQRLRRMRTSTCARSPVEEEEALLPSHDLLFRTSIRRYGSVQYHSTSDGRHRLPAVGALERQRRRSCARDLGHQ